MKRITILIFIVTLLISTASNAAGIGIMPISVGDPEEMKLIINEETIIHSEYAGKPYDKDGVIMLPL